MTFDENAVNRDRAGRFDEKPQSAPEAQLFAQLEPQPEDVLTPESSITALTGYFDTEPRRVHVDSDGHTCADFYRTSYGQEWGTRVVLDDRGDVVRIDERNGQGGWENHDHLDFDRQRWSMQERVNVSRLAFAGVLVHNEGAGTGVYGHRFLGGRAKENIYDASQVSKNIRQDIKRAQQFGAIPDDLTYSVRTRKFAGGQAIDIYIDGTTDDQLYVETEPGFRGRSPWASSVRHTVEVIGNQWQDDQSDSQQDYFHNNYYLSVQIPDEQSQAFAASEKARLAARRAAKR